jgi:hypothetical protein
MDKRKKYKNWHFQINNGKSVRLPWLCDYLLLMDWFYAMIAQVSSSDSNFAVGL